MSFIYNLHLSQKKVLNGTLAWQWNDTIKSMFVYLESVLLPAQVSEQHLMVFSADIVPFEYLNDS